MNKRLLLLLALSIAAAPAQTHSKKAILFLGDGAGVSSLNAASIYGYSKPQALYLQRMPRLALADTSTAREWVTDAAASFTAVATGVKTRLGVLSQSSAAERGAKDGESLKTILEYAEEHGLSTGVVSNDDRLGVTSAPTAAFYAHSNDRQRGGDIFLQLLNPKSGNGVDVVIGTGRKAITEQTAKLGHDISKEIPARGYAYVDSLQKAAQVDAAQDRLIALFDDADFNFDAAVQLAVSRLEKNPKGYLLVAFSDCHLPNARKTLARIVEFDKAVESATEAHQKDTLVLVTADHSYDLRLKGETLTETARSATPAQVVSAISLESQHTAEEVPVLAAGPGSDRVHGFMSNADLFHVMLSAFGWEKYRVETRYPIGGDGGWDYITADSGARRLYISHATQVEVLDSDTGKPLGVIADTPGVHGVAIAPGLRRGFTTNGKEDKVSIFDTDTLRLIAKVDVGKGPDGIFYEGDSRRVFTNNHGSHDITAIDAASGKVVGQVKVAGDAEQMVAGRDGLLYVNLEDTSEVVAFDPRTLEVLKRFPIAGAKTPTGLAYDRRNNRLFIGCRSKSLVVMDAANGKVITSMPIGTGVDAAGYDPETRLIFVSTGDGVLSIFHQKSADEYEDAGAVQTQAGAKTLAFDTKSKKVFLPSAEVEVTPAADASAKPKRTIKPGTFGVVVVSPL